MDSMMRWLSGETKKDSLASSRENFSPLAWVGLLSVAIGTGLFAVFGMVGMKLLVELVNMLDGVPETGMRIVWENEELVLTATIILSFLSVAACIYHWHFYYQWEKGADISEKGVVRWLGMFGIAVIYLALVWSVLLLVSNVTGSALAKSVHTAQGEAITVFQRLMEAVNASLQRLNLTEDQVEKIYEDLVIKESVRVRNDTSFYHALRAAYRLSEIDMTGLGVDDSDFKCARQCVDLTLVAITGRKQDQCICALKTIKDLGSLCDRSMLALDRGTVGLVLLALGTGILQVRTAFWFGITTYSKLPSTVPVHGVLVS